MSDDAPIGRRGEDALMDAIRNLQGSFDHRHEENTSTLSALEKKVDRVLKGFPDGDPDGHRRFHEAMIRKAEAKEKFWNDMRGKLVERGIWAVIGLVLIALGIAAKDWLRR
tara:strand:+ start:463002 stop:463334 length:333 start_codon:yes stop_codon:yes gene_type:complete